MKTNSRESTLPGIVVWSLQTHLLALNCFVLENFGVKLKLLRVFCSCFLNLLFEATFRPLTHISTLRSSPIHFQFLLNEDTLVGLWQYLLCFEIFTKWLFMFVNQFAILSLSITPKCCFITSRFFLSRFTSIYVETYRMVSTGTQPRWAILPILYIITSWAKDNEYLKWQRNLTQPFLRFTEISHDL